MIIAVDFDGTVVDHRFPDVGPDVPSAVAALRALVSDGHKIILWTMRSGVYLDHAVQWYAERGIPLHGINGNPDQSSWTSSPKAYAQCYVDDAAVGCPLIQPAKCRRPCVDWVAIMGLLHKHDAGPQGGHSQSVPSNQKADPAAVVGGSASSELLATRKPGDEIMHCIKCDDELPACTECSGWSKWVLGTNANKPTDDGPDWITVSYSHILCRWHRIGNQVVVITHWMPLPPISESVPVANLKVSGPPSGGSTAPQLMGGAK